MVQNFPFHWSHQLLLYHSHVWASITTAASATKTGVTAVFATFLPTLLLPQPPLLLQLEFPPRPWRLPRVLPVVYKGPFSLYSHAR